MDSPTFGSVEQNTERPKFSPKTARLANGVASGEFDFDSGVQNLAVMNPTAGLEVISLERMFQASSIELLVAG